MSKSDGNFFMVILWIYLAISQILTFYFWWQWAQEHGFWNTVFFGFFVAEFKGLLWIFFVW